MKLGKIYKIYLELYKKHGNPVSLWPQWCARKKEDTLREIIAIGAIMTQRTGWRNANLALKNLKKENFLSLNRIAALTDLKKLTDLTRPAGFYQTKPKRLFAFASFIVKKYGSLKIFGKENLETARSKLLDLYGIGPETADTILLYALDKPTFVIDEYTKGLVKQRKLSENLDYYNLKELFEENLPKNPIIFQNFHALIIIEQKGRKHSLMEVV
jgi:endonuclease-3 related protein